MGLFLIRFRFDSTPPSRELVESRLQQLTGPGYELDDFRIKNDIVEVTAGFDVVTAPYARKVLSDLGGRQLGLLSDEPQEPGLPEFVERPWKRLSIFERMRIKILFHLMVWSTALHRRR